ncbi:MAG: hypothetical protein V1835_06345 [Candidatus Micrarchaeota archaeon]
MAELSEDGQNKISENAAKEFVFNRAKELNAAITHKEPAELHNILLQFVKQVHQFGLTEKTEYSIRTGIQKPGKNIAAIYDPEKGFIYKPLVERRKLRDIDEPAKSLDYDQHIGTIVEFFRESLKKNEFRPVKKLEDLDKADPRVKALTALAKFVLKKSKEVELIL